MWSVSVVTIMLLQCEGSIPCRCNETAISLKASCQLFLRYTTRTNDLDEPIDASKARLIEVFCCVGNALQCTPFPVACLSECCNTLRCARTLFAYLLGWRNSADIVEMGKSELRRRLLCCREGGLLLRHLSGPGQQ